MQKMYNLLTLFSGAFSWFSFVSIKELLITVLSITLLCVTIYANIAWARKSNAERRKIEEE